MRTDTNLFLFFCTLLLTILFFIASLRAVSKFLEDRERRQEEEKQARERARRLWMTPFREDYAGLHASLLNYVEELQRNQRK